VNDEFENDDDEGKGARLRRRVIREDTMFKTIYPTFTAEAILGKKHATIPHCDQRILHAPRECEFCDMHPEWQALRVLWGIAFTGYTPEGTELPCPADAAKKTNG
jgi:hypothetical protein